ncbi:MAG: ParB N-terminal domain-containing protein [Rhodospirillales bacterium]|nr:ParB N-terminal domain-containing protein [Rhodospirillales bacterium]
MLFKSIAIKIDEIYVPAERRKELDPAKVELVAEEIMAEDEEVPIQVREGKGRYVLIKGVHRLEARKALGEATIRAHIVSARQV